jgi:hypothetical protein
MPARPEAMWTRLCQPLTSKMMKSLPWTFEPVSTVESAPVLARLADG